MSLKKRWPIWLILQGHFILHHLSQSPSHMSWFCICKLWFMTLTSHNQTYRPKQLAMLASTRSVLWWRASFPMLGRGELEIAGLQQFFHHLCWKKKVVSGRVVFSQLQSPEKTCRIPNLTTFTASSWWSHCAFRDCVLVIFYYGPIFDMHLLHSHQCPLGLPSTPWCLPWSSRSSFPFFNYCSTIYLNGLRDGKQYIVCSVLCLLQVFQ